MGLTWLDPAWPKDDFSNLGEVGYILGWEKLWKKQSFG